MSVIGKFRLRVAYGFHLGLHPQPERVLREFVFQATAMKVAAGNFKGIRLMDASLGSALLPKLAGTYELELRDIWNRIFTKHYSFAVDVGCAEGYYAVGLARALGARGIHVHAYDTNPEACVVNREVARCNHVKGLLVESREFCPAELGEFPSGLGLIVCDIEGGEIELLDPALSPRFTSCDILVEVHDGLNGSTIRDILIDRFDKTHIATVISARSRSSRDLGLIRWWIPKRLHHRLLDEGRTMGLTWIWFESRANI